MCVLSRFSHVQPCGPHQLKPTRLLCPWDSPGKNTVVGYHALLPGIFLTQALNPHLLCLLHWHVKRDSHSLGCFFFFFISKFGKWICITFVNRIKILRGYFVRWIANCYNEVGKSMHACKVTSVLSGSLWPHCSPSGYSVHWILQARILEWVAVPSSRGSSPPMDQTHVSYVSWNDRQVLYH